MKNRRRPLRRTPLIQAMQSLEPRQLLSFSVAPNSAVVMHTSLGEVTVQLYTDMPITTTNFLSYVTGQTGANYNGTVFHRIAVNGNTQLNGQTESYSIVQGGGYTNNNGTFTPITTSAPIINETTNVHTNSAGTIAMARTSSPDSATSQFFFNVTDNSSVFPDPTAAGAGYTTFGTVIRGLGIVDTIDNLSPETVGNFSNVPETSSGGFVTLNTATEEDTMTINIGPNDAQGTRSVTFMDPQTKAITNVSISGGDATILITGDSKTLSAKQRGSNLLVTGTNLDLQSISSTDSTAKTNLNINASGGQNYADVGDINITGSINSINGGTKVDLTGGITVSGGVKTIKLLASQNAGFIDLDTDNVTGAPSTIINIPFLSDISIQSNAPIQQLISRAYNVDDGTSRGVSAPSINQVRIFGTLGATIQAGTIAAVNVGALTSLVEANTITSVNLNTMTGGIIYAANAFDAKTLDITKVNVKGAMSSGTTGNAQIVSAGNIGSVHLGSMANSDIIAGVDTSALQSSNFPTSLASNATLGSVSIGSKKNTTSFSNSQIAAYQINSLHLGRISTNPSSGTINGVQSHVIKSLVGTLSITTGSGKKAKTKLQPFALTNLNSQSAVNTQVSQKHIDLNDATIGTVSTGTTTTTGLTANAYTYSTLTLSSALAAAIPAGTVVTITDGANSQTATLSAAAEVGDTTLTVTPFTTTTNIAAGATIQGTTATATTLTSGVTYSAITLSAALANAIPAGTTLTLTSGINTQAVTLASDASAGDTTLSVTPFAANFAFASGTDVAGAQVSSATTTSGLVSGDTYTAVTISNVLSSTLTAGSSITITDGTNTQTATLAADADAGTTTLTLIPFTATATIASSSTVEDNSGNTLSGTLSTGTITSTSGISSGYTYTNLTLNAALGTALASGSTITITDGTNTQTATLAADAAAGTTTLSVTPFTATATIASGGTVENSNGISVGSISTGTITATTTDEMSSATTVGTLSSGTATTNGLISGVAYTVIGLAAPAAASLSSGNDITITTGSNSQFAALGANVNAGDASITASITPDTNYPVGSPIQGAPGFIIQMI